MTEKPRCTNGETEIAYANIAPSLRTALETNGFRNKIFAIINWFNETRAGRTLSRYNTGKGNLLAGGIAYVAMFSIASTLAIGITILMSLAGKNPTLKYAVFDAISDSLPGVLNWKGAPGVISPDELVITSSFSIGGIASTVVLILSATYIMSALKSSIRQMFGIILMPVNAVVDKLTDLLGFITMAVGVAVTAIVGIVTSTAGVTVLTWLGISSNVSTTLLNLATLFTAAIIDGIVLFVLVRFVAGVRVPRNDMLKGIAIGITGSAVLRYLGTSAVGSIKSPLLASFAALITILLWVNLLSRLTLYMCAFMANPPSPAQPVDLSHMHADETPNYVTLSVPHTLEWPHQQITGTIEPDPQMNPQKIMNPSKPRWGGIIGAYLQWRIKHHRSKIDRLNEILYHSSNTNSNSKR